MSVDLSRVNVYYTWAAIKFCCLFAMNHSKKFWNQSVRNGNVSTLCHAAEDQGQYLVFGERVGGLRIENNHYFVSRLVSTASLNFQYVTSSIKENTEEATTRDVHPCILTPNQRNYKSLKDVEDFFKPKKSG